MKTTGENKKAVKTNIMIAPIALETKRITFALLYGYKTFCSG